MTERVEIMKLFPNSLVIAACCILMTAGLVGPGPFRWVLLAIAALIGVVLARRALAGGAGRR